MYNNYLISNWEYKLYHTGNPKDYRSPVPYLSKKIDNFEIRMQEWNYPDSKECSKLGWRWDIYDEKIIAFGYCNSPEKCEKVLLGLIDILKGL